MVVTAPQMMVAIIIAVVSVVIASIIETTKENTIDSIAIALSQMVRYRRSAATDVNTV